MAILRRWLLLAALLFWQGGGAFYGAVAIPIGRQHLDEQQSLLTRDVTRTLNYVGVVALALTLVDLLPAAPTRRRWPRLACWLGMAVCQAALFDLHARLSLFYDVDGVSILDPSTFWHVHKLYLLVTTVQFVLANVLLVLSLAVWRE